MPHFSSVTSLYHGKVNVCMAALLTMFIYHSFSVERFVMTLYWPVNLPWVLFRLNSVLSTVQVWQTGVVSLLLFISLSRLVFHLPDSIVLVSLSALWTATPCPRVHIRTVYGVDKVHRPLLYSFIPSCAQNISLKKTLVPSYTEQPMHARETCHNPW